MQTYEKDVVSRLSNLVSLSAREYNNFIFGHSDERRNLFPVVRDSSLPGMTQGNRIRTGHY